MTLHLASSESDSWYTYLLQEKHPFTLFLLFDYCLTSCQLGPLEPSSLLKLLSIPIVWGVYCLLGRVKSKKSRLIASFMYYEVVQLAQLQCALEYPDMSNLWVISSTIVLTHLELGMFVGKIESGLLIVKHFLMWYYYAWKSTGTGVISTPGWIALFWCVYHLYHVTAGRKAVLLRRQEDLRELREEKDRMQALLQAIPDGVAVITEDRCVVTYNQMLLRMLQLEGKPALDKAISDKFHALAYAPTYQKTAKIHEKLMDDVLAHITKEKENTSIDFGSVLCGGHFLEWRGTISHWSRAKACILVVRDVGEWVELEALAKKESEAKSALIRSVSHELRTPINAIINISETLLENQFLSEQDRENCRMLVSSSNFLLSNVNDLLDFSRIANQKFTLNMQMFRLEDAVRTCAALIKPQCRVKGLYLGFRYDSSVPALVRNDPNRLKQVILNLLSNALKFTLKGKIEIIVTLINPQVVRIAVEDTGIGIAEKNQQKIFTMFGKLTGNEQLNPQGCGLGLAISNTLVVNMGGEGISVNSTPGHGSTFSFHMPISDFFPCEIYCEREIERIFPTNIDENIGEITTNISKELWKDPLLRANTLIADDSEFNRLVLKRMLEGIGFRCDEASTGTEALHQIEQREQDGSPYLYVFLDIEMPEMSGIEVAVELRRQVAERRLSKARVVGCSAYVSSEDRQSCMNAGMDYFLEKPVFKETLIALCSQMQY